MKRASASSQCAHILPYEGAAIKRGSEARDGPISLSAEAGERLSNPSFSSGRVTQGLAGRGARFPTQCRDGFGELRCSSDGRWSFVEQVFTVISADGRTG